MSMQSKVSDYVIIILNGTIPKEFQLITIESSSFIERIDITRNDYLVGTIPNFIFQDLTALTHLDLSSNSFSGTIPLPSFNSNELTMVNLASNVLTGSIPDELYYTLTELTNLDLKHNELGGTISSDIGALLELETLNLTSNNFVGTIPTEIGYLTNLSTLSILVDNAFVGGIPTELNSITSLHHIV